MRCEFLRVKTAFKAVCLSLVVLPALTGCDQWNRSSSAADGDFQKYGIFRIMAFIVKPEKGRPLKYKIYQKTGTAFLANDKNLVVTNNHVIEFDGDAGFKVKAPIIKILSINNGQLEPVDAEIITRANSGNEDLALLRPKRPLPGEPLPIADYEPYTGSEVKAVGYPGAADAILSQRIDDEITTELQKQNFGPKPEEFAKERWVFNAYLNKLKEEYKKNPAEFSATYTQGVVSRHLPIGNIPFVQHQAPINKGNSGGPLLDACGSVIAINTYGGGEAQGIAMSLGSPWVAEQIRAAGLDVKLAKRCFVGSTSRQITYVIGGAAVLLTFATLLFAFRRTPTGQRGYTRLTRAQPTPVGRDGTRAAPVLRSDGRGPGGSASYPESSAGGNATVRLIPVGGGRAISLSLNGGGTVGRGLDCDAVIDEQTVSTKHARLSLDGGGRLTVEDLGSANGTWKNGVKVKRETFASGDTVRFGAAEFRIELPGSAAAPIPTAMLSGGAATAFIPEPKAERPLVLSGLDGEGRALRFSLKADGQASAWTFGRQSDGVDFVIPHPRVSSMHARIRYQPKRGFEICDLGSSNGTRVDNRKVDQSYTPLDGARTISLGDCELSVSRG